MLKPQSLGQAVRARSAQPILKALPSIRACRIKVASRPACPFLFRSAPQSSSARRVTHGTAAQSGRGNGPPATLDPEINFKKGFWTFVDIVAILGSIGGALAAILNLFTGTYVLFLPLVLPVVSLLSALQREGLIAEDNRRAYDTLRSSLARDSSALLADARGAIDEVRRELKGQNTTAARLGTIEARLSSLEGSILSAGRSAREAAAGLGLLPDRLQTEQRATLEGVVAAMRVELRRAAESLANNETTALARLDARLAAVEGSLSGLEVAQSEGLRRLSMSLNSALADAEATLQSSVRNEVARSMEPVRRLPQMLAAALPPALAAAEAVEASANGSIGGGRALMGPGQGAGGAAALAVVGITPEQVQVIIGSEVEAAVGRILTYQADAFGRLNVVRPVPLDEEQWSALGRRLTRLERLVEAVPAGTEETIVQGGQLAAAVAAAARDAATAAAAEAAAAVTAAAAREAETVRNDILAAQAVLRERLDGLSATLQPLQLGVTELQLAVAAVSDQQQQQGLQQQEQLHQLQQQQQQQQQRAQMWQGEEGQQSLTVAEAPLPPSLPPAELSRLLDGVTAVAALLRDVDAKMNGVAAAVAALPKEVTAAAAAAAAAAPVLATTAATAAAADATAVTTAAEAVLQQQGDLQAGIDSMRETLAALAVQVEALAPTPAAAVAPMLEATGANPPVVLSSTVEVSPPERRSVANGAATTATATTPTTRAESVVVADVLAFEASITTKSAAGVAEPPPALSLTEGAADRPPLPPATAGATREAAYDMMLQLAEARRRSGSETSSSGRTSSPTSSATGTGSSYPSSSVSSSSVSYRESSSYTETSFPSPSSPSYDSSSSSKGEAGAHLRIEGLPPFEQSDLTPVAAIIAELSPLPPLEPPHPSERRQQPAEGLQSQQPPLPLQGQQTGGATITGQYMSPAASRQSPAETVYGQTPVVEPLTLAPPQPLGAGSGVGMGAGEGEFSYGYDYGAQPPPQQQQEWQAAGAGPAGLPYQGFLDDPQQPQQPLPQQQQQVGPGSGIPYGEAGVYMPYDAGSGYADGSMEAAGYGWQEQQQQPSSYMPYEGTPGWYDQAPPLAPEPSVPFDSQIPPAAAAAAAAATAPSFGIDGMQQGFAPGAPYTPTSPAPPLPLASPPSAAVAAAAAAAPVSPATAVPAVPTEASGPSTFAPGWPAAPLPPLASPVPSTSTAPTAAAAPAAPALAAASAPALATAPAAPGFGDPAGAVAAATPGGGGGLGSGGLAAGVSSPPPSAPSWGAPPLSADAYRMRPLEGLSAPEVISEGLRMLRMGREETRRGEDFGLADLLIQSATAAFTAAADLAPEDAKALGNLGNSLLARGELKATYLEVLRSGPPPSTFPEAEAQKAAEVAMTAEANTLLTEAGVKFMRVLELEGWSSRALVNWGRALVIRADLLATCPDGGAALLPPGAGAGGSGSQQAAVVAQLYTAAIDKFEGVLEGEPDMIPAKYRCALAMAGLSRTRPPASREALTLLVDAINYLRDVIASPSADAEALRPAAAAALAQYDSQLMAQRAARGG